MKPFTAGALVVVGLLLTLAIGVQIGASQGDVKLEKVKEQAALAITAAQVADSTLRVVRAERDSLEAVADSLRDSRTAITVRVKRVLVDHPVPVERPDTCEHWIEYAGVLQKNVDSALVGLQQAEQESNVLRQDIGKANQTIEQLKTQIKTDTTALRKVVSLPVRHTNFRLFGLIPLPSLGIGYSAIASSEPDGWKIRSGPGASLSWKISF